jgi:hypothetical protein
LLFRLPDEFLVRFAGRAFDAELLKLPPRLTRLEPPLDLPTLSLSVERVETQVDGCCTRTKVPKCSESCLVTDMRTVIVRESRLQSADFG